MFSRWGIGSSDAYILPNFETNKKETTGGTKQRVWRSRIFEKGNSSQSKRFCLHITVIISKESPQDQFIKSSKSRIPAAMFSRWGIGSSHAYISPNISQTTSPLRKARLAYIEHLTRSMEKHSCSRDAFWLKWTQFYVKAKGCFSAEMFSSMTSWLSAFWANCNYRLLYYWIGLRLKTLDLQWLMTTFSGSATK